VRAPHFFVRCTSGDKAPFFDLPCGRTPIVAANGACSLHLDPTCASRRCLARTRTDPTTRSARLERRGQRDEQERGPATMLGRRQRGPTRGRNRREPRRSCIGSTEVVYALLDPVLVRGGGGTHAAAHERTKRSRTGSRARMTVTSSFARRLVRDRSPEPRAR